jgi:hypothetical protein
MPRLSRSTCDSLASSSYWTRAEYESAQKTANLTSWIASLCTRRRNRSTGQAIERDGVDVDGIVYVRIILLPAKSS